MAIRQLPGFPKFLDCDVSDKYRKKIEYRYELDGYSDINPFLLSKKKKGGIIIENSNGLNYVFEITDIKHAREAPMPGGAFHIIETVSMQLATRQDSVVLPWDLPPYNFSESGEKLEETVSAFWPAPGDSIYPDGLLNKAAFVNTAGVPLSAVGTKGLTQKSFSYNLQPNDYVLEMCYKAQSKVNDRRVTVCGQTYDVAMVLIDSFRATQQKRKIEYVDANGAQTTQTWEYMKIDVQLTINPQGWVQNFLNVGAHVRTNGGLQRLWSWTNAQGQVVYGSYKQYQLSGATDGEEVSENMFLSQDGTSISPFSNDGRQVPTFRRGIVYEPVNFDSLKIPTRNPQVVDEEDL